MRMPFATMICLLHIISIGQGQRIYLISYESRYKPTVYPHLCVATFLCYEHVCLDLHFLLAHQKKTKHKKNAFCAIAPRAQKQALRCWEKLDWATCADFRP